jgi:autotransporter-associated beta strand protein
MTVTLGANSTGSLGSTGTLTVVDVTGGVATLSGTVVTSGSGRLMFQPATAVSGLTVSGTVGSNTLVVSALGVGGTVGLVVGQTVTGTNIPTDTYVTAINGSTVTLSGTFNATAGTATFAAPSASSRITMLTSGTTTATLQSTLGLFVGQPVFGPNVPLGTTVASILDGTRITLSGNATSTATGNLYFGQAPVGVLATGTLVTNSGSINMGNTAGKGIYPGMSVSGVGVPVGAVVGTVTAGSIILLGSTGASTTVTLSGGTSTALKFGAPLADYVSAPVVRTGTTNGTTSITGLSSLTGLALGMVVSGTGIGNGVTITGTTTTGTITLSSAVTGSLTGGALTFRMPYSTYSNVYTGPTVVNQGVLQLGGTGMPLGALAVPGDLIINSGASVTQATNFNASIANTSNVTINGGGSLTLTGSNTLANLTFNNNGGTVTPTVTTGGTLVLNGTITSINDNLATTPTITGNLELAGRNLTLTTSGNSANDLLITGTIRNVMGGTLAPAGLIKNGAGSVTLNAPNTFNGGVQLNLGSIIVANANALGASPTANTVDPAWAGTPSTTLTMVSTGTWAPGMVVYGTGIPSGTRIVSVDSATQVTLSASATVSPSTVLSAGGSLTVTGGTLMSGTATITVPQPVMVRGTLTLGGPLAANNVNLSGPVDFDQSRAISVPNPLSTATLSGTVSMVAGGTLTKTGAGILSLTGSVNSLPNVLLSNGILAIGNSLALGTGTLRLAGGALDSYVATGSLTGNNPIVVSGSFGFIGTQALNLGTGGVTLSGGSQTITVVGSTLTAPSAIGDGGSGFGLTKAGWGTLSLTAANTYTGPTTVLGGVLSLGIANALSSSSNVTLTNGTLLFGDAAAMLGTITATGGSLIVSGGATTFSGGMLNASSALTLSTNNALVLQGELGFVGTNNLNLGTGTVSLSGGTRTIFTQANLLTLGGVVVDGGTSAGSIIKAGGGTLALSGTNTFTGGATLLQGTLSVLNDFAVGSSGSLWFAGGTLQYGAGVTADLSARFGAIASGTTAFVDVGTSNVSFATGFSGSGGFSKLGSGVLTLTGASSYLGVGSVLAGVLNVQNATALGGTAAQTVVSSGATMQLQGGLNFGAEPLTISGNGLAGQSGALLNVSGANTLGGLVTLGAASIIASDAGTLTLGGGVTGAFGLTLSGLGNGVISGSLGTVNALTKSGPGAWTYAGSAAGSTTTNTVINGGSLVLDFVNLSSGSLLAPASSLTFGGGALVIKGRTGAGPNVMQQMVVETLS